MFSDMKVKLHGMKDERWTTKDKFHQYRGLFSLYMRDKKIMDQNRVNASKNHVRDLIRMQKEITSDRHDLDNAIHGDTQKVRNTLGENRSLQLAYQHLHPCKIVDHIYHENFNKRKELDRIRYKHKLKFKELICLKLELAELQERLIYEGPGKIEIEIDAGIITAKVQEAILKKEAAITVRHTYINIINIMKKDRIYYDAVISSLKQDCAAQGMCLLNITRMGQLATENLDDRRQEFKNLELQIRFNMKKRSRHVDEVNIQLERMVKNVKNLVRRDSDVEAKWRSSGCTIGEKQLHSEIHHLAELLDKLRTATVVTKFDDILPCMVTQRTQIERLTQLYERNMRDRDCLLNKKSHTSLVLDQITNTMNDTTMEYKQEKSNLLQKIREQQDQHRTLVEMVRVRGELTVNIRRSLEQLYTITMPVNVDGEFRQIKRREHLEYETDGLSTNTSNNINQRIEQFTEVSKTNKLIEILAKRLGVLAGIPLVELDNRKEQEAEVLFQNLMACNTGIITQQKDLHENELVEGTVFQDAHLPTRESIKLKSKKIVDHNKKLKIMEANTAVTSQKSLKAYKKARSKKK